MKFKVGDYFVQTNRAVIEVGRIKKIEGNHITYEGYDKTLTFLEYESSFIEESNYCYYAEKIEDFEVFKLIYG